MRKIALTEAQNTLLDRLGRQRELAEARFQGAMMALAEGDVPDRVDTDEGVLYVQEEGDADRT